MAKNIAATVGIDGEKEFKQAISSINSDMKVLASEMKKVTSEFSENAKSVESLTAKDKVLNDQIDKQREKVEELRKAMENSKTQYPDNEKKLNEWKTSLNNAETGLIELTRASEKNKKALEEAKNPTVQLTTETTDFGNAADKAGGHALKMGDIIKANLISGAIITGVKALASALVGVAKQSIDMISQTIETTSTIADNSKKVGMSAEEYQKWTYAAEQSGMEQETLTAAMIKQQTSYAKAIDGTKEITLSLVDQKLKSIAMEKAQIAVNDATNKYGKNSIEAREALAKLQKMQADSTETSNIQADIYKKLGISLSEWSSSEAFEQVILKLANMKDETERNFIATSLFGKSYAELAPLLAEGADGIEALRQRAIDLNGVMSNEAVAAGDKLGDTIDDLKFMFSGVANEIITSFMPELQKMADWVLANKEEIKKFGTDVIGKIAGVFQWFADNKDNIASAFKGILDGIMGFSNNKDVIVLAVIGIAGAFTAAAIAAGAFQSAWSIGINAAFIVAGIYAISSAIDAVTGKASKVPNVTKASMLTGTTATTSATQSGYSVAREFVPKAAKPLIDWNAEGAIFTRPTIFNTPSGYQGFGEAGPEVAMPLSNLAGIMADSFDYDRLAQANRKGMIGLTVQFDNDVVGKIVDARLIPLM